MKILQLAKKFNHGGVATHVTDLSEELITNGHQIIVASSNGTHVDELNNKGIKHNRIEFSIKNPFKFFRDIYKLIKVIKQNKINIVHCHNRSCALYMTLITKVINVPFLWSLHQENIPSNIIYRKFTSFGERAIAPTISLRSFLITKLKVAEEKISIVYYGIDLKQYKRLSDYDILKIKSHFKITDEKVITLLGRLEEIKGHKCLLEAVNKLDDKQKVKVLFVGDSDVEYKNKLDQLIGNYGIKDQIIYTGYISARDVLSITDMMVLPSYKDGITLAVLNSFAMGVPVVRTKTSGYLDVKEYCIGMDFDDSDFLAKELEKLVRGKDYTNMIDKAMKFVQKDWSKENMTAEILKIYNEILYSRKIN